MLDKFKDVFYDGNEEDPECAEKPKKTTKVRTKAEAFSSGAQSPKSAAKGRGKRAPVAKKAVAEKVMIESDSESEVQKSKNNKRRKVDNS